MCSVGVKLDCSQGGKNVGLECLRTEWRMIFGPRREEATCE